MQDFNSYNTRKMIEYLYAALIFISFVLIYYSYTHYIKTQTLLQTGNKTTAIVIRLIEISNDDGYTFKPVLEYNDLSNNKRTFESEISSSPAAYKIGEKVSIIYDFNNSNAKILSYWGLYRWTILLLCVAAPLLIIGGGYYLFSKGLH